MTANAEKKTEAALCECRYLTALSSDGGSARSKEKFSSVPNTHEIDEDSETEEEEVETTAAPRMQPDSSVTDKMKDIVIQDAEDPSEDEFAYTDESFCSDESEVVDVTPESLVNDSSSLSRTTNLLRRNGNAKSATPNSLELRLASDDFDSASDEPSRVIVTDGFVKSRKCRRWNMSFTDEEMRRIERENQVLLRKIMAQQKPRHKALEGACSRASSSAINRTKLQKKINNDNMLLVRRIQQAKSCVLTDASKMNSRLKFL